jgi:hypothetical protein
MGWKCPGCRFLSITRITPSGQDGPHFCNTTLQFISIEAKLDACAVYVVYL